MKRCKYSKCNKEFVPEKKGQLYCCEACRVDQNRERSREAKRQERLKRKKKKSHSLAELQREARMYGMSYGMYVAQMQKGAV